MILGVTGHRPEKLGGHDNIVVHGQIRLWFQATIKELGPTGCISGMALGADQLFAEACILEGVPFVAAVPAIWQSDRWPREARVKYISLLEKARDVVVVSPPDVPFHTAMQLRNEFVVDGSDAMCAVWDGSPGGTANTMKYLEREYPNSGRMKAVLDPRSLL